MTYEMHNNHIISLIYNEYFLIFLASLQDLGSISFNRRGDNYIDNFRNRGAQEAAAIEPPFLWILSFGGAKESISPSGANTRLTHRRDSDLIICFLNC